MRNRLLSRQMRKNLEGITEDSTIWKPGLDLSFPINGQELKGFRAWINWNGSEGTPGHKFYRAFDFAAYLTTNNMCVLGLPEETSVLAVADGIVRQVRLKNLSYDGYTARIHVEHGRYGSGMFSSYGHVIPLVEDGQPVKKGAVIATLYKDSGNVEGRLVHLHFELTNGWGASERPAAPEKIFREIGRFEASSQAYEHFTIPALKKQPTIYVANFKSLLISNQ